MYSLEQKKLYCTCAFLDILRVFYRRPPILIESISSSSILPVLIRYYHSECHYKIEYGSVHSDMEVINTGVLQGGILSSVLLYFVIFVSDQSNSPNTSVADYDDKVLKRYFLLTIICLLPSLINRQNPLDYSKTRLKNCV